VRIEIGIYVAQGGRLERHPDGTPVLKTYATIVPIVTANRLRLDMEELGADGGIDGEEASATGGDGEGEPTFFGAHNAPGKGGRAGSPSGPRRGGKTSGRPPAKAGTGAGSRGGRPGASLPPGIGSRLNR
jgi:hypothetical protein